MNLIVKCLHYHYYFHSHLIIKLKMIFNFLVETKVNHNCCEFLTLVIFDLLTKKYFDYYVFCCVLKSIFFIIVNKKLIILYSDFIFKIP